MKNPPEQKLKKPETVHLSRGELEASMSVNGGWLESFSRAGRPVLFPKQTIVMPDGSSKVRGGSHVCLPNFGPGGESGLAQHGFGRTSDWELGRTDDRQTTLRLRQTEGDYAGLSSTLIYSLTETGLTMNLALLNESSSPLRVAPGFHPYFVTGEAQSVLLYGQTRTFDGLSTAEFLDDAPSRVGIGETSLSFQTENLSRWVLWTDRAGEYVCLEPTFAGNSFEQAVSDAELLAPGQTNSYSLQIDVS